MLYLFVIYFTIGIFLEFLSTLYVRYVAQGNPVRAAAISFINTVLVIGLIYSIIDQITNSGNYISLVIYAAGVAVGTYVGTQLKLKQ